MVDAEAGQAAGFYLRSSFLTSQGPPSAGRLARRFLHDGRSRTGDNRARSNRCFGARPCFLLRAESRARCQAHGSSEPDSLARRAHPLVEGLDVDAREHFRNPALRPVERGDEPRVLFHRRDQRVVDIDLRLGPAHLDRAFPCGQRRFPIAEHRLRRHIFVDGREAAVAFGDGAAIGVQHRLEQRPRQIRSARAQIEKGPQGARRVAIPQATAVRPLLERGIDHRFRVGTARIGRELGQVQRPFSSAGTGTHRLAAQGHGRSVVTATQRQLGLNQRDARATRRVVGLERAAAAATQRRTMSSSKKPSAIETW